MRQYWRATWGEWLFDPVHRGLFTPAFSKCLVNACCVLGNVRVSRRAETHHRREHKCQLFTSPSSLFLLSHCSSSAECQPQNPFLTPHTCSPLLLPWPFLSSHLSVTCVGADMSPLFLFFSLTPPNRFDPCVWVERGCIAPWGHSNKLPNTGCLKTM